MKNKLNRNLLVVITAFSLLLSSCSGFLESEQKEEKISTVRISLAQNVRTALPSIKDESDFKKIKLEYQKLDADEQPVGDPAEITWETDSTDTDKTAALQMSGASIRVEPGFKYSFTLYAYFNANETESYYSGTCKQDMAAGENIINFTLTLEKLAPESGKGSLSLTVQNTGSLKKIVLSLSKKGDSDYAPYGEAKTFELAAGENTKTVDYPDVDAGYYKALLEFYDSNGVKIGYNVQYATIVNGITSKNIEEIDAAAASNKNALYSITYDFATAEGGSFAADVTAPGKYSRFTDLKLPNAVKSGKVFLGWYLEDAQGNPGEQIKKIEAGTISGDIKLAPKFFDAKEVPVLTTVTYTDDSGEKPRFRDTLTAVLKDSAEKDFTGTVTYQWYRGSDPIEGATNASYQLTADDIAKNISVKVTQKYTLTQDSEIAGLYALGENPRTPVSSTAVTVEKGKLSKISTSSFRTHFYIDGVSSNDDIFTIIGESISPLTHTIPDDHNYYKNQIGETVGVTLKFADTDVAPETSAWMDMLVTAENYETLGKSESGAQGFVAVQYSPLTQEEANALLRTDINNIPRGQLKFKDNLINKGYEIPSSSEDYANPNAESWSVYLSTNPFDKPEKLYVRRGDGKPKVNPTPEGYIKPSVPTEVQITAANIGVLVTMKQVDLTPASGELRFGDTVTANLSFNGYSYTSETYDAEEVGQVSYDWWIGYGTGLTKIEDASGTFTGSPVTYKITDASAIGKRITVTFEHSQKNNRSNNLQKATEMEVEKALIVPEGIPEYSIEPVVGTTLNTEKLTGVTFKNQAGVTITPSLAFASATAPSEHKTVKVKATLDNYEDKEFDVQINVKAAVPGLSGYLSTDTTNIPYGHIKFTQTAIDKKLMYSTAESVPQTDEGWTLVTSITEFEKPAHLYLRIQGNDKVHASDASADLVSELNSYVGTRSVVIKDVAAQTPAITFDNNDVKVTASGKTLTANVPTDVTISDWEIPGEELTGENAIATVSEDKKTLTFKDSAPAGVYQVILWASRGSNMLSATYSVKIGSGN